MKGLSNKEIEIVSFLELNEKNFFTKDDVKKFFKNNNELKVYINRLKAKKRIIKINKSKYYLVPVKAYQDKWSENPFIVIDEIFNGENYFIGGYAAPPNGASLTKSQGKLLSIAPTSKEKPSSLKQR